MSGASFSVRIEFTAGQKFAKLLAPESFRRHMRRHIPRATGQNAAFAAAKMRKIIQSAQGLQPNAPLTIFIKGSSKPLVDKGDLFQAITHKKLDEFTGFAGVDRNDPRTQLMKNLHDGVTIRVTPAMRGMFFALYKASIGELDPSKLTGRAAELFARRNTGWLPLSQNTTAIIIPGRPFTKIAIEDAALRLQMKSNWERAIQFVFRDMKREFSF